MSIPADDLGRGLFESDPDVRHRGSLDVEGLGTERGSRSDGPGHLADDDSGRRLSHPFTLPRHLGGEDRDLESERDRYGGLAAGPPEHDRLLMLRRQVREGADETIEPLLNDADRVPELEGGRTVLNVVARRPQMDVLAGVARARLREGEDDGHEVVPRLPFELLDSLHGHELRRRLLRDLRRGLPRDEADLGLR